MGGKAGRNVQSDGKTMMLAMLYAESLNLNNAAAALAFTTIPCCNKACTQHAVTKNGAKAAYNGQAYLLMLSRMVSCEDEWYFCNNGLLFSPKERPTQSRSHSSSVPTSSMRAVVTGNHDG